MLSESNASKLLPELRFPPFKTSFEIGTGVEDVMAVPSDWLARMEWEGFEQRFCVEYKRLGSPREIENSVAQLRFRARESNCLPMLMAPYLRPQALDRILDAGFSGIDLSGNGVVFVPGRWLVYRTGERNKFRSSAPIKSIYDGTSSLVGRAFFIQSTFDSVSALRNTIIERGGRISLGTVSKVLQRLDDELIVSRNRGIRLLTPELLLERLASAYQPPKITNRIQVRANLEEFFPADGVADSAVADFKMAVSGQALFPVNVTSEPVFVVYTSSIESLLKRVEVTVDRRFSNVEVCETTDQRVYFDCQVAESKVWTSPVQVFLELARGSERDRTAALEMRDRLLKRKGLS